MTTGRSSATRHRTAFAAIVAVGALAFAACAEDSGDLDSQPSPEPPSDVDAGVVLYRTTAMVTQTGDHQPKLCLQVADFSPPWCFWDIELDGWSWDAIDDHETDINSSDPAEHIKWAFVEVEGTWTNGRFTAVNASSTTEWPDNVVSLWPDHGTDCPEPRGGWFTDVDESRLGDDADEALDDYVLAQPDFVDLWFDSSMHPEPDEFPPGPTRPAESVLNVRFADDADRHEAALREIWGGPLCVTTGGVAVRELEAVRAELVAELEHLGSAVVHPVEGYVLAHVVVAEIDQDELDRRFGAGRVRLVPALEPTIHQG